ncbi:MAG: hypothetical protein ISR83_08555 [Candidatus Marinimicrobia bacterium]|nr:hypothetical protein [Candidatus Neomarinimicrobiota bacterium]
MNKSAKPLSYPSFPSKMLHLAIIIAGLAGFTLGAHIAFLVGFDYSLGKGYHAYIQSHGHIQLIGWVGLFIMSVSLYFMPRLGHFKIEITKRVKYISFFITIGILLKYIFHSALPYYTHVSWTSTITFLTLLSSVCIFIGILIYLSIVLQIANGMKNQLKDPTKDIRLLFIIMILGWILYGSAHFILSAILHINSQTILLPNWNLFMVDIFIYWIILPICFGVGLRAIPLFMRLPSIQWNTLYFSKIYFAVVLIYFGLKLGYQFIDNGQLLLPYLNILGFIKNMTILWFVYQLDVIIKLKVPWTDTQKEEWIPHKKESRKHYPDYGEFGHFEWLIKSAFIWLVFAALLDAYLNIALLLHIPTELSKDGIRHAILLGFTTPLIMGMGVRMVPGMTGALRLKNPGTVLWIAVLVNGAAISRVLPMILPSNILDMIPNGYEIIMPLFGVSGILGVAAIWLFYFTMNPVLKGKRLPLPKSI